MVGCLMYLTATRPDIQHAVSILSRFLHCANEEHLTAAKRVLRYLKGTQGYGVRFLEVQEMKLVGYVDSDWGSSAEDMKSTTGFCFSLGSGCFSWSTKKQEVVAQSTAEAEFVVATAAAKHAVWLRKLLCDRSGHEGEQSNNTTCGQPSSYCHFTKSSVSWQDKAFQAKYLLS